MSFPRYPKYKDSGVEWLGEVPEHWDVKRLKHASARKPFAIVDGPFGTQLKAEDYRESGVPLVRISNLGYDGRFRREDLVFIDSTKAEEVARSTVVNGDVVIGKTGATIGKSAIVDSFATGVIASSCIKVSPDTGLVSSEFLLYCIISGGFQRTLVNESGGSTRDTINITPFGNLSIPLPPAEEQFAVTSFLDRETAKIDVLVAEQQRLMELLKEKRQAVISHAVTKGLNPDAPMKPSGVEWLGEVPAHWEVVSIKWLSPVRRGASPRPIDDPKFFDDEGEYAWVRIADVSASDGQLIETTQQLSDLGSSLSVKIEPGDLFVSIAGTVGKPCITRIKACIHDGFVYFPGLTIEPAFLYRIFESGECYGGLGKMGTQLNLNTDTIGSIRVALPPVSELREILRWLEDALAEFDELTASAQHTVALLQERRSALISAAVTGQIDVRHLATAEAA